MTITFSKSVSASLDETTGLLHIRIDNPPVNALSSHVRSGLHAAILHVRTDPAVRAALISATGKTFVAGADIREFAEGASLAGTPDLNDTLFLIESSAKPVVVFLHGTPLGGGLELALAAHIRIASPDLRAIGLPEVKLGLIPGAGGTQRLPRLVGAKRALAMIVSGKAETSVGNALSMGLIDDIGTLDDALRLAARVPAVRRSCDASAGPYDRSLFVEARKQAKGGAQHAAIAAVEAAVTAPTFEVGLAAEREEFMKVFGSDEAMEAQARFFASRSSRAKL
mmetsp:Transcript_4145/g.13482  ORF Transcript_4145/g.13482 Transcript_4145/m.13482 type:complete len:282 (-) Transcript_4145:667-1512(-)